jgi:hypothetical protein
MVGTETIVLREYGRFVAGLDLREQYREAGDPRSVLVEWGDHVIA